MTVDDRRAGRQLPNELLDALSMRLRLISEPTRIRLMWLLDRQPGATAKELSDGVDSTYQNVTKHLVVMHHAGLVSRSRDGNNVRYQLVDWTALWVIEQIANSATPESR